MVICDKKVVTLDYTLTDNADQIIDQSKDGTFAYLHGAHNIIPGLEKALLDKKVGDSLKVSISPEEGYGLRDDSMIQEVSIDMFETADQVQVGQQFHAQGPEGHDIVITVTKVENDSVTIDGNHPLAGVQLNFDVTVVDIRDASEEEVAHGHAHHGDHHHH